MRAYTRDAVIDKFRRALGNMERIAQMLQEFGIEFSKEVLVAYWIAVLRTMAWEVKAHLEGEPATEEERREAG